MPAPPPPAGGRRRWKQRMSPTLARDRCYARSFRSAGLRQVAVPLPDGAVVHIWRPRPDPALHPVLLLHGFGANATWQWAPFSARFSPPASPLSSLTSSSLVTPRPLRPTDPRPARPPPSPPPWLLPGAPQRYSVVGVSYGGFVAYHLAHAFPAVVERLVLVAAGVCLEETDLAAGLFAVEDVTEAASLLLPQRPEDLRRLVELTFYKPPKFMPSCFIRDYITVMCTENVKEKTELLYALISGRKLSDLPKINQQTLIIWGEQDRVFPLELGLRLQRHLGDTSELIVVKNAGHAINREKPAELCRLIKNYIIDPSVKYRDGHKGCWKFVLRRFAGSSLKKMDSSRPLI